MKQTPLLCLFMLVILVSGCRQIKAPEFRSIDDFHVQNVSLQEATLGFRVTYFNPNKFDLAVKETEVDVYLDGIYVGNFTQDTEIAIIAASDFSIPLKGTVPFDKLLQLNLQDIHTREVMVRAEGNVRVGRAGVFITRPFLYEGMHRLSEIRL